MTDQSTGDSPLSIQDAGAQIAAGLFAESEAAPESSPSRPRGPDGKFLPTKPREEGEPEEQAEEVVDETPGEEAPEKPQEQEEEDEPPAPRLLKVKVDGIEQEVPEDEVVKGYSRTADYTRKTQALAEEKRKFEAEELSAVRAERQQYAERLEALHTAVQALMPETEPDWGTLRNTMTPEEFTTAFADYQSTRQRVEKIRGEQQRIHAIAEADAKKIRQSRVAAEQVKLQEAIPELKDPVKGKELKADLIAYALSLGYTEDELEQVEDHRPLILLHESRLWRESQKRRPKIEEKIDRALEAIKPSGTTSRPRQTDVDRGRSRLAQTGRVEDAAALISLELEAQKKKK